MRNEPIRMINTQTKIQNLVPISDGITKCDLLVLYEDLNRNGSFISREVIEKYIAPSLPGRPIVGYYSIDKQDFLGHEQDLVVGPDGELTVRYITVPFGSIATDTEIWWEKVIDVDGVEREYLGCQGYIWTGRYPETKDLAQNGKNVSMELNPDTLKGFWSNDVNSGKEIYIISEAYIDAICILGDDIEPAFEGASIIPTQFSLQSKEKFDTEMSEFNLLLKEALQYRLNLKEGGEKKMDMDFNKEELETIVEEEITVDVVDGQDIINSSEENVIVDEPVDFTHDEHEEEAVENLESAPEVIEENHVEPTEEVVEVAEEVIEEPAPDYQLMLQDMATQYNEMVEKYEALKAEYDLIQEKLNTYVRIEKQNLIAKYSELDETEVVDIVNDLDKYSIEQIDTILAARAYKKVKETFSLHKEAKEVETPIAYNLTNTDASAPAWVKTLINKKKSF